MATDAWRFCMRDRESGQELFETRRGELIMIVPAAEAGFALDEGHGRQDW